MCFQVTVMQGRRQDFHNGGGGSGEANQIEGGGVITAGTSAPCAQTHNQVLLPFLRQSGIPHDLDFI